MSFGLFTKTCPWCEKQLPQGTQLGQRPAPVPAKWYQFSKHELVCPLCNSPVAIEENGRWWMLLALPLPLGTLAELIIGPSFLVPYYVTPFLWGLLIIGAIGYGHGIKLKKVGAA